PTIIYGITQGEPLGRGIRRSELDSTSNPYNTYQIDGLPPTPIANPGRDAIAAVLNPPEGEYYYFVADGTGGHAFASSLAEHNRNVARWRRIERERAQGG
ncbi:MAG TPA: aminodeoxychorismate lyase, partial [Oceanicaulis sp.]|nr:aminodeoxychorismate lyase [Oceanicaulis sp.]